ncbi:MAG: dihydrofolate reductase [Bacillota bacterium]
MKAIVAVDSEWGIGKNNDMLFHLPLDLAFFKEQTMGKTIVMGRKTLLSFPNGKPLPKRENIVLSSTFNSDQCLCVQSMQELKAVLNERDADSVFIVGGAMFYNTMINYCSEAIITKIEAVGGATHFFPNLDDMQNWTLVESSTPQTTNGYTVTFTKYVNNAVLAL